jgi:hypothetical protein
VDGIAISWTLRKRVIIALWAAWAQWQALREALRPADPYLDPDYVSPELRVQLSAPGFTSES